MNHATLASSGGSQSLRPHVLERSQDQRLRTHGARPSPCRFSLFTSHFSLSRTAFTLVELAMTALLLSIGLLTVFALLRRGLASRMEMEDEIRAASFAETTFNTLRAESDQLAASTNTADWAAFWLDFNQNSTNLPIEVFGGTNWLSGGEAIHDFTNFPSGTVLRYACSGDVQNTFSESEDSIDEDSVFRNHPTNRVAVTLHVWPSGSTNTSAQTFFTLFSNPGRLP